jgi:hypothetical protein
MVLEKEERPSADRLGPVLDRLGKVLRYEGQLEDLSQLRDFPRQGLPESADHGYILVFCQAWSQFIARDIVLT